MSARTFRLWSWVIVALLIAATIGFPVLLKVVVDLIVQGRHIGGARGAVALVFGIYGKLILIALLGLISAYAVGRRAYTTGQSAWWGLFAFLAVVAGSDAIFTFGNFWAANFVVGMLSGIGLLMVILASAPLLVLLFVFRAPYEKCLKPGEKFDAVSWPGRVPTGKIFRVSAVMLSFTVIGFLFVRVLIFMVSIDQYLHILKFSYPFTKILSLVGLLSWFSIAVSGILLGIALRICARNGSANMATRNG